MNRSTPIITIVLFLLVNFTSLNAQSGAKLNCTARVITAKTVDKPFMDPQLKDIQAKLTKGAFSSFNYFAIYSNYSCSLEKGKPAVKIPLEVGSVMNLQYLSSTSNPQKKSTLTFSYSIIDSSGKSVVQGSNFNVTEGDTIILTAIQVNDHYDLIALKFNK